MKKIKINNRFRNKFIMTFRNLKDLKQYLINKKLEIILLAIILIILLLWNIDNKMIIFTIFLSFLLLYAWQSGLIRTGLKHLKINKRNLKKKKLEIILLAIILILLLLWQFKIESIVLLLLFFSFLFFKWDSRFIASMALLSLASCPFLLIFKKEPAAEQMAIYAYYFLVMTVVLQIVEYKRQPGDFEKIDKEKEKTESKTENKKKNKLKPKTKVKVKRKS